MRDRLVVDAGALLVLVLPDTEARIAYGTALIEGAMSGDLELVVPQVCHLELAAVLSRKMRGGVIKESRVREFFAGLDDLGLGVFVESFTYAELFDMAQRYGCQVGDSIFVQLAAQLDIGLATLDNGQRQAAKQIGVRVWAPGG